MTVPVPYPSPHSGDGRLTLGAAPRLLRPGSDPDVQVQLRRVGELLAEVGRILSEIQLAAPAERGLMEPVERRPLMSANQVAELLGTSPKTVRRWARTGRIPRAIEIGGVCRWRPEQIAAWIEEQGR